MFLIWCLITDFDGVMVVEHNKKGNMQGRYWGCEKIVGLKKNKMYSLSTHPYADGGVGEVFESTKHFWSLRGKQQCSQIQYSWSQLRPLLQTL